MVLDPEPRPVTENIPIDIPSERTPFTPRLSLPPVPAADAAVTPPPDQGPRAGDAKAPSKSEARIEPKAEAKADDGSRFGTSLSGIVGGFITLGVAFLVGLALKRRAGTA